MSDFVQFCNGCKVDHPIDQFRFRDKASGNRHKRCKTWQDKIDIQKRYEYGDTKTCLSCDEELPTCNFWLKSRITGRREARCGFCMIMSRDPEKRKKMWNEWYYNRGGKELVHQYNQYYKPIRNARHRFRCENDPAYRTQCLVRCRIYDCLKRAGQVRNKKIGYLGISGYEYRKWLECQFDENMTWANQGSYWHIDHVKP